MKWFLVDVDNIAYRAHHSFRNFSHNGKDTGILYGFLKMLTQVSYDLGEGRFLFAFDSRPSIRSKMYPGYKANRKAKDNMDERVFVRSQIDMLQKEILPAMGWKDNILHAKGYEADDLIAVACEIIPFEDDCVIVSNDKDYYQLLENYRHCAPLHKYVYKDKEKRGTVSIYQSHNRQLYTYEDFREEHDGIIPAEWIDVLVLAGCSTDGIKGIDGIGIKSAIKWLNEDGDAPSPFIKSSYYKKIVEGRDEAYRMNYDLVRLPFKGLRTPKINNAMEGSSEHWDRVVKEYGMESLVGLYPDGSSPTSFKKKRSK